MSTREKLFHLGDILSITTGRLVSKRGMEGVYEILNFMSGDSLYTHQLPRVSKECAPVILAKYPQLAEVDAIGLNPENHLAWLDKVCAEYGEEMLIEALPKHAHEFIDPMSELVEMVHPDKIITVQTSGTNKPC